MPPCRGPSGPTLGPVILAVLELAASGPESPAVADSGHRWELAGDTVIGRGADADLTLAVEAVSRRHAEVRVQGGRPTVVDLGSRNGTTLNGVALVAHQPAPVDDGDEIVLAGALALRFHDPLATPIVARIGRLRGVWVDPDTTAVWVDARRVEPPLSARQLRLLEVLAGMEGEVVSRAHIVDQVWDDAAAEGVTDDAVTALVKRLRRRLDESGAGNQWIEIIRGRGVRLRLPD